MEIVAMDMKLRGMYIARQLSFHGVAFKIEEVPLSPDFVLVYDNAVALVRSLNHIIVMFLFICRYIFQHTLLKTKKNYLDIINFV